MASVSSAAPARSGSRPSRSGRASGSSRAPATRPTAPTGTLTRNTQRQSASTSSPPITGPRPAAMPPIAAQLRMACGRRSGAVLTSSSASEVGIRAAAPAACRARAATSQPTPGATAHSTEATVKAARPRRKPRRCPYRSASRPATTSSAAKTIAYALSTQDSEASELPSKESPRAGTATLTMNRSRFTTKTPAETIQAVARDPVDGLFTDPFAEPFAGLFAVGGPGSAGGAGGPGSAASASGFDFPTVMTAR